MSWQGIDGLLRTRDGARANAEATLRLGTVLAQWEQDLTQIQDSAAAPALKFDGAALRLTRHTPEGVQFVVWTRQGNQLWRWASPSVTRVQDLQDWWIRGQQWTAISADALAMLDEVTDMQVYYYQARDNSWSNAQSTGNVETVAAPAPPASGASDAALTFEREALPRGVRLQLAMPGGPLTRDLLLMP
jgi:general secretion pathway protein J